ncbi:general odorant-binding protein 28a-like [Calliphora vicina]|uniref:general odorant-binding protein 28a-like n=1 Tax=Calliphora vicina TaxID=7373 RepID=UPI00325B8732
MKFLIVFAFLILAALKIIGASLSKEDAITFATGCKDVAGASDADLEAIVKHQPVESKEGKCMRACVLKKFEIMSDEGKLLKDAALEISKSLIKNEEQKELVAGIIDICDELEVSDDHCEAAEEYGRCWRSETESKGITSAEDLLK